MTTIGSDHGYLIRGDDGYGDDRVLAWRRDRDEICVFGRRREAVEGDVAGCRSEIIVRREVRDA